MPKIRLWQLSALCLLGLTAVMAGLLLAITRASEDSVRQASALLVGVDQTSRQIDGRVRQFLWQARKVLDSVSEDVRVHGQQVRMERWMQANADFAEVACTWAVDGRQTAVFRDPSGKLLVRMVERSGSGFVAHEMRLGTKNSSNLGRVPDPRSHLTFKTLLESQNLGKALWSDLHYSQLDVGQKLRHPRVEVSVQESVLDKQGKCVAVVRVGRWTAQLDSIRARQDGQTVFLCDTDGKLVTRLESADGLHEVDGDIRVKPVEAPPSVLAALENLKQRKLTANEPDFLDRIRVGAKVYIACFRLLPDTQGWVVGVIFSEKHFLEPLLEVRSRLLTLAVLLLALSVAMLAGLLHVFNGDLRNLMTATRRMKDLDFSPTPAAMHLQDVDDIAASLEGAKATLRAMTKYVPVDLVRLLFERNLEPHLGGELRRLTIMFTDIANFTTTAENQSTTALAERLAEYLQRMGKPIAALNGTLLERIGDALLVVWNAPTLIEDHPRKACLTALACRSVSQELGWHTRFGIHTDQVMVGHFGSSERLNYGILGDGVNLCSRIEGLNKHYGTSILVSRSVAEAVQDGLEFRLIDRVAVKGRTQGIELYELMGETGQVKDLDLKIGELYEAAFRLYLDARFSDAALAFEKIAEDPPARTLAARSRRYQVEPPPANWGGIFVASFK